MHRAEAEGAFVKQRVNHQSQALGAHLPTFAYAAKVSRFKLNKVQNLKSKALKNQFPIPKS